MTFQKCEISGPKWSEINRFWQPGVRENRERRFSENPKKTFSGNFSNLPDIADSILAGENGEGMTEGRGRVGVKDIMPFEK